ncbi:MAG: alcohol dehydrogenase catalytic domain-containing protein [Clostridiales bacterium]|nr:alcohol dehydrogenase catalytic domain-containing protein [Clostridiales bacterium]
MKAAVWHGYKDIRIEDVPEPEVKPGHVKIKVAWAGICGTDRHEYVGPNFIPTKRPHRLTGRTAPLIMGHEFSGIITEVGEGVTGWKVDDRVTANGTLSCGECPMCLAGRDNICYKLGFLGVSTDGAFAEYVIVNQKRLFKIPDNVGLKEAVLCEPLACGKHALDLMNLDIRDKTVVVSGDGIIGISAAIACLQAGAKNLIVSGIGTSKKEFIEGLGARYVNVAEEDLVDVVSDITESAMAHIAFECVGVEASLHNVIKATRPGAAVMIMGVFEKPPVFPMNDFQEGEKVLYTSQAHLYEIGDCLELMSQGKYPYIHKMITGVVDLENIVEGGFEEMNGHPNDHIKMLVRIAGDEID